MIKKLFAAALAVVLACSAFASASAVEPAKGGSACVLTVKSAQSLFEPVTVNVPVVGETYDIKIKLRSEQKLVDAALTLGFDSRELFCAAYRDGKGVSGNITNITDEWQSKENCVNTQISAGSSFFDFTAKSTLITYTFKVLNSAELTVDIGTLTANKTVVGENGEEIDPKGDVPLVRRSKAIGEFDFAADVVPTAGDVDLSGKVDINDVTTIQLGLVGAVGLSEGQRVRADVYSDDSVTIRDATTIQLYLAKRIYEL